MLRGPTCAKINPPLHHWLPEPLIQGKLDAWFHVFTPNSNASSWMSLSLLDHFILLGVMARALEPTQLHVGKGRVRPWMSRQLIAGSYVSIWRLHLKLMPENVFLRLLNFSLFSWQEWHPVWSSAAVAQPPQGSIYCAFRDNWAFLQCNKGFVEVLLPFYHLELVGPLSPDLS